MVIAFERDKRFTNISVTRKLEITDDQCDTVAGFLESEPRRQDRNFFCYPYTDFWCVLLQGNTRSHSEYGSKVCSADDTWLATARESR